MVMERLVTFFVDAEEEDDVYHFLEENPEWVPGDVDGLIDHVTEEDEMGYTIIPEAKIRANFKVTPSGELVEK